MILLEERSNGGLRFMINVNLICNDLSKIWGTDAPLKARLTVNGSPLSNKNLVFNIHGVDYTRVTDVNGYASVNINLEAGTYQVTVKFLGDSTYNPATVYPVVRVITNNPVSTIDKEYANYFEVNKIPLKVLTNNGFDVKPGQNIKETQLLYDDDHYNSPTFYFNSGYDGDEFECSIYLRETYSYNGQQVMQYLNAWNKMNTIVSVVTDSMIVPNGKYTMQIKDKKQTNKKYSIWKLRFKQFYENNMSFESIYETKLSTVLSSLDLLLLKQTTGIDSKSNSDVIKAMQSKLEVLGWRDDQGANGVWGFQTSVNLFRFQCEYLETSQKQGKCDYDTVKALVQYTTELGGLRL